MTTITLDPQRDSPKCFQHGRTNGSSFRGATPKSSKQDAPGLRMETNRRRTNGLHVDTKWFEPCLGTGAVTRGRFRVPTARREPRHQSSPLSRVDPAAPAAS